MKKLMILAAVVCATVVGNAANINWSITDLKDSEGSTLVLGHVYTFSSKEANAGGYKTTDALKEALLAATDVAAVQAILNTSYSGLNGDVNNGSYSIEDVTPAASGLTEGKKSTKLFAVVIDTDELGSDTKWYVTDYSNAVAVPTTAGITSAAYSIADTGSATSSNWHSIPEPTSGLLLLLGVAGLALRRRRA